MMRRRSVLSGLGTVVGASVAGCLGGDGDDGEDGGTGDNPPWLNAVEVDVDRENKTVRIVANINQDAGVQEIGLYGPDGNLDHRSVVDEDQSRVNLGQVDTQARQPYYFGMDAGHYEVFAQIEGEETETQPVPAVPEFSLESVGLWTESGEGNEYVSGFRATVQNTGMYPHVFPLFGPVDGVPNPPDSLPGSAEPIEADSAIAWPRDGVSIYEQRLGMPGPLVVPAEDGVSADDAAAELEGEGTATLEFHTGFQTGVVSADYRLEGDVVETGQGFAMTDGEVLDFEVEQSPNSQFE